MYFLIVNESYTNLVFAYIYRLLGYELVCSSDVCSSIQKRIGRKVYQLFFATNVKVVSWRDIYKNKIDASSDCNNKISEFTKNVMKYTGNHFRRGKNGYCCYWGKWGSR